MNVLRTVIAYLTHYNHDYDVHEGSNRERTHLLVQLLESTM